LSFDLKIIAGDLKIENGNLAILRGKDKLAQDLVKIATTELGANPLHSWYGSMISSSLIGSPLPREITDNVAQSQLQNAIDILKELQTLQASTGQKMTPDEQISYIQGISIQRSDQDMRVLKVFIKVLTKAFGTVNVSFNPQ
jgi:hypothetical protein